jgi:hypothetical protein
MSCIPALANGLRVARGRELCTFRDIPVVTEGIPVPFLASAVTHQSSSKVFCAISGERSDTSVVIETTTAPFLVSAMRVALRVTTGTLRPF